MTAKIDIAWLSPLPPKATGIAGYSEQLLQALDSTGQARFTLYDTDISATTLAQRYSCRDLMELMTSPCARAEAGLPVYQLGNNASYHGELWRLMQRLPGVVILHDAVLFNMMAAMGRGRLLQALAANGLPAFSTLEKLEQQVMLSHGAVDADTLQHYPNPEHFPLLRELNSCARVVIVHNQTAADTVRQQGYTGPLEVLPHLSFQDCKPQCGIENPALAALSELRRQSPELRIVGLFGFRGDNKQADQLLEALTYLPDALRARTRLLIVGSGHTEQWLERNPFAEQTINLDYVSDDDFQHALQLTDLLVNLRYPSFGETSGVQMQAMTAGCATVVSNTGWFSELPAEAVWHVPAGELCERSVRAALIQLLENDQQRADIALAGQRYVADIHAPDRVARQLMEILRTAQYQNAQPAHGEQVPGPWAERYMRKRMGSLMQTDVAPAAETETATVAAPAPRLRSRLVSALAERRWVVAVYHQLAALPVLRAVLPRVVRRLRGG